jgi:hypothetical protein
MFKLVLTTIPHNKRVYDYLVFTRNSEWVIQDFCRSSGLELPDVEADIDLVPRDCLWRVCYAELIHGVRRDGRTRLEVERYVSRGEALRLNPALLKVQMPPDTPAPKRLRKAGTGLDAVPAAKQEKGPEVEADDIPF